MLILPTATGKCAIDVTILGPRWRASWYDFWGSAVMIVAMCAKFGLSGVASTTCMKSYILKKKWSQLARQSLRSESKLMSLQLCRGLQRKLGSQESFCWIVLLTRRPHDDARQKFWRFAEPDQEYRPS